MLIAYGLVFLAVGMDFWRMRISNRLILMGLAVSLVLRVHEEGVVGLLTWTILVSFPVILLYLLFLVRALGAGDIKLFSLIGGFLHMKELIWCISFSFLYAAVFSLLKMIYCGTFFLSMKRVMQYLYHCFSGTKMSYYPVCMKEGQIHFSLAILLGLITTDLYFVL